MPARLGLNRLAAGALLGLSLLSSRPAPAAPTAPTPTASPTPALALPEAVTVFRSPYRSLAKNRQFLNTLGLRAMAGYQAAVEGDRTWATSGRPGIEARSLYTRNVAGRTRTVELAISPNPAEGFDLYLFAAEGGGLNPDQPGIRRAIELAIDDARNQELERLNAPLDPRTLSFEPVQLSYVHTDQALGLLKALGYTVIEYTGVPGENLYQKIYAPNDPGPIRLPIVLKMLDAPKTSLQEPPPPDVQLPANQPNAAAATTGHNLLPDLGGLFLHHDTSADPQQRLLIAYDPDDMPSLERLTNFIREKIDVPAQQIVIEALVVEIRGDYTRDLGVEWQTSAVSSLSPYRDTIDLTAGVDKKPGGTDPLTFVFGRHGPGNLLKFQATLKALLETSKAQILSSPSLLVLDGRQARIQVGDQIPVPSTTIFGTSGQTESVSYFPVGIVLNLRPRISDDASEVSMQIETIVSSVRATAEVATDLTAPTVASRQVQTMVRVANDTPFIIGGLTAHNDVEDVTGVPGLAEIPWLGALFRRQVKTKTKNEVIIVVTPHIVPKEVKNFSYVIPQESKIFDSFGHQLFYNAFRIRHQDVFDLNFVFESRAYKELRACAERWSSATPAAALRNPDVARLLDGGVPGEDVLVRRMLFETIRKTDYLKFVDTSRIIFFEDDPGEAGGSGFKLSFLQPLLADQRARHSALELSFDMTTEGTPEHPFVQPRASASYLELPPGGFDGAFAAANQRLPDGRPKRWSILLGEDPTERVTPIDLLKGVIVLKRLLDLNPDLALRIHEFRAGRQIVFPTEADLSDSYHLLDPDAARIFYELHSYYQAFEQDFKASATRLLADMGGCADWSMGREHVNLALPQPVETALAEVPPPPVRPQAMPVPTPLATPIPTPPAPAIAPARPVSTPAPSPKAEARPTPRPADTPPPTPAAKAIATPAPAPGSAAGLSRDTLAELETAHRMAESGSAAEAAVRAPLLSSAEQAFRSGDPARGYLWLGRLYLSAGLKHASLASLRRASSLDPSSAEIRESLAQTYDQLGKPGDASRVRQQAAAPHAAAPAPEVKAAATPAAPPAPTATPVAQAPARAAATPVPTPRPEPARPAAPPAEPAVAKTATASSEDRYAPLTTLEIARAKEAIEQAPATERPKLSHLYDDCLRSFSGGDPARGYLLLGDLYSAAGSHRAALSALYAALRLASSSQIEEALARVYEQLGNESMAAEHAARARSAD